MIICEKQLFLKINIMLKLFNSGNVVHNVYIYASAKQFTIGLITHKILELFMIWMKNVIS